MRQRRPRDDAGGNEAGKRLQEGERFGMLGNRQTLEVLNPDADIDARKIRPAQRVQVLAGKKIGLASNRKPGANWVLKRVSQSLSKQFSGVTFENFDFVERPFTKAAIEMMSKSGCDAFVGSNAD